MLLLLFSCSVVSDSLQPHRLQHARLPCPSLSPGVYSNSFPLSRWCLQTPHPLLPPSPSAVNLPHHQGLFQWVGSSHQVTKASELQFQHQSFNEHSELISFRIDWFDLLAVQGALKSLLQHHNLKASVLQHSALYMVEHSPPNMTTGKTTALTLCTFVGKVVSAL